MITVIADNVRHVVQPTIFPDGTSQVWNLPKKIFEASTIDVVWHFENEREIMDVLSLRRLFEAYNNVNLHMPFLPYGRQDKQVDNASTFNLHVFADVINSCHFKVVSSVDVHNPKLTEELIYGFENRTVEHVHEDLIQKLKPSWLVYPDAGAKARYHQDFPHFITFDKERDQATGKILSHKFTMSSTHEDHCKSGVEPSFLIIDDICDGGATFISIARELHKNFTNAKINLFVTHGIFSKGKGALLDAGISGIYTTNSITKNQEGYEV